MSKFIGEENTVESTLNHDKLDQPLDKKAAEIILEELLSGKGQCFWQGSVDRQ